MLGLRKTDLYLEASVLAGIFISVPVIYTWNARLGLAILGCIQLLSAGINTPAFLQKALSREIKRYWWLAGCTALALIISCLAGINAVSFYILFVPAAGTAAYYLFIYRKLIHNIQWRNELAAFTKS